MKSTTHSVQVWCNGVLLFATADMGLSQAQQVAQSLSKRFLAVDGYTIECQIRTLEVKTMSARVFIQQ